MAKVIEKVGQAEAEKEELISGSEAIAVACKLAAGDVITAYPIRPYDTVMQYVAKLVSNGEMDCEYIVAESEHSQFEIVKHASAAGARVFCGSSGVGWMDAFQAPTVTPARSVWSITTRWRCATWAGSWSGWTPHKRRWTPRSSPTVWRRTAGCFCRAPSAVTAPFSRTHRRWSRFRRRR